MEARIILVSGNKVLVTSSIGSFWANWCSPIQSEYKNYFVELDCSDILLPSSIQHSLSYTPSIVSKNKSVVITGIAEQIEDNILFLRVHSDLLMLEVSDCCEFSSYLGQYVNISLSHLNIYPTDL